MGREKLSIKKVILLGLPREGQCADFYTPEYVAYSFSVYPPLGLLYIATTIKNDYSVEIIDGVAVNYSIEDTVNEIISKAPDVLGISCQTFRLYTMAEIIKRVKAQIPDIVVVVGGPHVSIYPDETVNLPGVDYAIKGDGEFAFKDLLDTLSCGDESKLRSISGLIFKENENVIKNPISYNFPIDAIKIPDRSLLDYHNYYTAADDNEQMVTMVSSRGCPFRCTFCDVQEKKYRWRSAQSVVDEMEHISKTFENPVIHVFDDSFNILKDRVMEICSEIEKRNLKLNWTTRARSHPLDEEMVIALKKAGLKRIHLGVESGSETTLKKINKGIKKEHIINAFNLCRKHGIETLAYFIIGFDWETKKDINDTISFIRQIKPDYILPCVLYPAAKTKIYEELLGKGKIKTDFWKEFANNPTRDFQIPIHRHLKTQKYLYRKLDEIYLTFYLSPDFVLNNLKSEKKADGKFDISQFFFKVKLAFLIFKSYLTNFISEMLIIADKNEIK